MFNNLPALDGAVVWIHGPQPVLIGNLKQLHQRVFWKLATDATARPVIYDLQTTAGPNDAIKLAGIYQLVTPVSGAVVLESKQ